MRKKTTEIVRGRRGDLFDRDVAQTCDLLGDVLDVTRLVDLAAIQRRRQVGRIGFDEQAIERDAPRERP